MGAFDPNAFAVEAFDDEAFAFDTPVPPVEPDPVEPSGGTGARRRRFAAFLRGGR